MEKKPPWRWRVIELRILSPLWFTLYLAGGIPGVGAVLKRVFGDRRG
ncbi:hypothetical protein [Tomitella biformata]|nr:hypothetical protein [Tomitella biformata]